MWGVSDGDLGLIRHDASQGLLVVHPAEAVGRRSRVSRDTRGAHRAREFECIDAETCVGSGGAPAGEPVALDEIHGIPVGARGGLVDGFDGESLRHLGAAADDRLDASDGGACTAWCGGAIELDGDDGAHACGDVSCGGNADGVACGVETGADEGDRGVAEEDEGEIADDVRKGGLADVHGAIDDGAWGALDACGACVSCGTGGAEGGACGTEGARFTFRSCGTCHACS